MSVRNALVIVVSDWSANRKVNEEGRDSPADGVSHVCPGEYLEFLGGEETQVKEEDGHLDAQESGRICSLQSE